MYNASNDLYLQSKHESGTIIVGIILDIPQPNLKLFIYAEM